jgi:cytochrome c-type biogenesis protein
MDFSLIIPVFIAGILTFLAPCTLPLVPGYLGFISGVSMEDLKKGIIGRKAKKKVMLNGLLYVLGFSLVFILLGTIFGIGGVALAKYRLILSRIGGVVIVIFGLYMLHIPGLKFLHVLNNEKRFHTKLKPGKPLSSLIFGATFALGWSPCVGPILGTVLVLSSNVTTIWQGTFLLLIFSLGLAMPFLLIAASIAHAMNYVKRMSKYLKVVSTIGGVFLIIIGVLLLTDNMVVLNSMFYDFFGFIGYDRILDYL